MCMRAPERDNRTVWGSRSTAETVRGGEVTQDPFVHTCIHTQEAARESQDLAAAAGWTCVSMPSSWRGVRGRGNIK